MTEEQFAEFGLTFGVTAFILYMLFIIYQLARESKAGKFGTFVLFFVLDGLYVLWQDIWVFPRSIAGYAAYRQRTPFLVPTPRSVRACSASFRN